MRFLICVGLRLDLPNGTIRASLLRQCANNGADSRSRLLPPRWLLLNLATHGPQANQHHQIRLPFIIKQSSAELGKSISFAFPKKLQKVIVFLPFDKRYRSEKWRQFLGSLTQPIGTLEKRDWCIGQKTRYGEIKISNMTHFWRWR